MVATLDDVVTSLTVLHDDLVAVKDAVDIVANKVGALADNEQDIFAGTLFSAYIVMLANNIEPPFGLVPFLEALLGFTMPTEALGVADILDLMKTHGVGRFL